MDNYSFSQVPTADIPRSTFNRSHGHKTTFDAGYLIPFYVDEALPGDTFNVKASLFARLATPIVPVMDNIHLDVFYFAVPNRLLWDKWQRFMGERTDPDASIDFLVPEVIADEVDGFAVGSIFDYFGLPTSVPGIHASALWSRAYNLIYNEWFRDQNLQNRAHFPVDDGPDSPSNFPLRKRGKRHDYFTSCLPWPQKGPGVELPLGSTAPVISNVTTPTMSAAAGGGNVRLAYDGAPDTDKFLHLGLQGDWTGGSPANQPVVWSNSGLVADLSSATAATINSLRQAFQIQKLLERDARGGTRYVEILRAHFGVVSPDARMQRPEYLGGGSINVIVNPVAQNSSTNATSPQGNLAAYAVAGGSGLGFTKSFVEHCVIIGMVMARADLSYQQGLPRMFSRRTRYDFYWPSFAHLGEQAVLSKEIFCDGTEDDETVFGYQERWAEYRYFPSKITGKFRSTDPQSLDFWHLAQEFTERPTLSDAFISEAPPIERIVAVTTEPQFIFDSHLSVGCTRPMPTYSVPGYIDHF